MTTFALIGAAGFVAPRHLAAMRAVQGELIAAADPSDSVGVLDRYYPETRFFSEIERFDRFLDKQYRAGRPLDYLAICSPNYLHDAHVRLALRNHAHAICEKPLVISPWNLDALESLQEEYQRRIFTILQLRHHPAVLALKAQLDAVPSEARPRAQVRLDYITPRGPWYQVSWKGQQERSGGVAMNVGVHFFDLLLWLFGPCEHYCLQQNTPTTMSGELQLRHADVRWKLSVDRSQLPEPALHQAHRQMLIDEKPLDLSYGFEELHEQSYRAILAGTGPGIKEARPSIELVHRLRSAAPVSSGISSTVP